MLITTKLFFLNLILICDALINCQASNSIQFWCWSSAANCLCKQKTFPACVTDRKMKNEDDEQKTRKTNLKNLRGDIMMKKIRIKFA